MERQDQPEWRRCSSLMCLHLTSFKKPPSWGLRDVSVLRSTYCSCRGHGFNFQLTTICNSGSRGFNAFWLLKVSGTGVVHDKHSNTQIRINFQKIINMQSDLLGLEKGLTVCTLRCPRRVRGHGTQGTSYRCWSIRMRQSQVFLLKTTSILKICS